MLSKIEHLNLVIDKNIFVVLLENKKIYIITK